MAGLAALADVDVAAVELERRIGPHPYTFSMFVEASKNSGAISTRPPMETTIRMPIDQQDRVLLEVSRASIGLSHRSYGLRCDARPRSSVRGGGARHLPDDDRFISAHGPTR